MDSNVSGSEMEPAIPANGEPGRMRIAIAMYCALLASYVLMAADRFLFPVLAPDVRRDFGFALADAGLLSTIFTLGLGVGGLPTGYLLLRFTRRSVLLAGIAIFSAATAMTSLAAGFWSMLACLGIMGFGMAMLATVMFALAASYFVRNRGVAIGSVNFCYGLGGITGPLLAGLLLAYYGSWRTPMVAFGLSGFFMIGIIALSVRTWFTEASPGAQVRQERAGAQTLLNRNTLVLTALSAIYGLVLYGFLGMYPTYLRESLRYDPRSAGFVMSFFGLGALASIAGGWLGDRFSPRIVLSVSFICTAGLGYLFFHGSEAVAAKALLSCLYGIVGSAVLYVNLAGYHVKAVQGNLAGRASGMFVTSLYGSSAFAGYLMGAAASRVGWVIAGEIQISAFAIVAATLSLMLRPRQMAL